MLSAIGYCLLVLAVVEFGLALLLARHMSRGPANRTAAFLVGVAAVYVLMAAFTYIAASRGHDYLLYYKVGWIAFLMFPAMMRLALLLRDPGSRAARWVAYALYPPWTLVWLLTLTTDLFEQGSASLIPFVDIAGPLETPTRAVGLVNLVAVVGVIVWVLRRSTGMVRLRTRYFLFGAIVFSVGAGTTALGFQLFGGMGFDPALGSAFSLPWVIAVAYSMVRHRLFDIRLAASKAAAVLVILFVAATIQLGLFRLLSGALGSSAAIVVSLCVIAGLVFLTRLHRLIQRSIDDVFLRGKYDYQAVLRESTRAVASYLDLDELLEFLFQIMRRSFQVQEAALFLSDDEGVFTPRSTLGVTDDPETAMLVGSALVEFLRTRREPLVLAEWEVTGREGLEDPVRVDLERLGAAIVIPLEYQGALRGLLTLSEKGTGEPYFDTDVRLLETLAAQASIAIENARLYQRATTDGLTGLAHQRHLRVRLEEEIARADRYALPLCLIMLDIDRFKRVNDTYGHQAGDTVIKEVARVLREGVRPTDIVARYGGEEFCVVLPHTAVPGAIAVTERLRVMVGGLELAVPIRVALSAGLSSFEEGGDANDLIERADRALYRAKQSGRDRLELSDGLRGVYRPTEGDEHDETSVAEPRPFRAPPEPLGAPG